MVVVLVVVVMVVVVMAIVVVTVVVADWDDVGNCIPSIEAPIADMTPSPYPMRVPSSTSLPREIDPCPLYKMTWAKTGGSLHPRDDATPEYARWGSHDLMCA